MISPFIELDLGLRRQGLNRSDAAEAINRSDAYVSKRFCGIKPFTIGEAYKLLALIREPPEKMSLYFPNIRYKEDES